MFLQMSMFGLRIRCEVMLKRQTDLGSGVTGAICFYVRRGICVWCIKSSDKSSLEEANWLEKHTTI